MPYPLITAEHLYARVGPVVLDRNLDDQNVGQADDAALTRILRDASSKVLGAIKGNYPVDAIKAMTAEELPEEIVRVTLDQAVAMMCQRHPEVMRQDWIELMKQADADLKALRMNERGLDTQGAPEPPKNSGGTVVRASSDLPELERTFNCGFGSF